MEARCLKGRQGTHYSYNAQLSVDNDTRFIVQATMTSSLNDRDQLIAQIEQTNSSLGHSVQEVYADGGYFKGSAIDQVENKMYTTCYVAINDNTQKQKDEEHGISFTYKPGKNHYICSQGNILEVLNANRINTQRGTIYTVYQGSDACFDCSLYHRCAKGKSPRSIRRHHNHAFREAFKVRMKSRKGKERMKARSATVEHPFGTLKRRLGHVPLLTRGREKVQTEIDLAVMAYNFQRWFHQQDYYVLKHQIQQTYWKI